MSAPVHLLWGEDGFLLREAALDVLGGTPALEVDAADWVGGELRDLATPSLLGEPRALVIADARSLSAGAASELASYLRSPDPDATLVVCYRTAERGKPAAALVRLVEPVGVVRQVRVPRKDLVTWLVTRARSKEIDLTPPAARALVETVGADPASLSSGLAQLTVAFPARKLTPELVREQFRGLGEQRTWDLCDRAFGKDLPGAMRSLRAIETGGDEPLKVLGAFSSRSRDLIRVRALPEKISTADLAKQAGLRFEWQGRSYRQQARNFSMSQLVRIHDLIVEADRALKSGASGDVVLPTLVAAIAAA